MVAKLSEQAAWVARARAGDQAAFAEIFARYERRIYSFVYRMMGNPDDAFDLTQETFLKAYRALGTTDEELNVNAWLHRIAANACTDVLRRRARVRWLPWQRADDELAGRGQGDPLGAALGSETSRAVRAALLDLPPHYRRALLLREQEGLSCAEVGQALGLSAMAAKSLLFRAREEFRRRYAARGDGETTGDAPARAASHQRRD